MSISLMNAAWKSDYPTGKKFVLISLCDNASDHGECYPSIEMIAKRCGMSVRTVFVHLDSLELDGAIRRENRLGRSTVYHLDPCRFCTPAKSAPLQNLHATPAESAPLPLQILHPTPAESAPITTKEPSVIPNTGEKAQAPTMPGVPDDVFHDFLKIRAAKKAPLTNTAIRAIQREADKAGLTLTEAVEACCELGWQSFNAAWYAGRQAKNQVATVGAAGAGQRTETPYQRSMRERVAEFSPAVARRAPGPVFPTLDAENVAFRRIN